MATKAKVAVKKTAKVAVEKKPRFVIADLVKEVKAGKLEDSGFRAKLKKHYTENARKEEWIIKRTAKLLRKAHRTPRAK
jgi:thiamine pyrophosphate-dependent acetolactate synthase large subunit-like protein